MARLWPLVLAVDVLHHLYPRLLALAFNEFFRCLRIFFQLVSAKIRWPSLRLRLVACEQERDCSFDPCELMKHDIPEFPLNPLILIQPWH